MNEDKIKVYIAESKSPRNDYKLSAFKELFSDKVKIYNDPVMADYILSFYPVDVLVFNARQANPPKKMYAEQFFIDQIPKISVTEEEKQSILSMLQSNDKESRNLGRALLFDYDVFNDVDYMFKVYNTSPASARVSSTHKETFLYNVIRYIVGTKGIYNKENQVCKAITLQ